IRSLRISDRVSYIAAIPIVREFVDQILRKLGKSKGVVMDGRDIGTAVFPEAELKIFMTASDKVRAERRLAQMLSKGEEATMEDVLRNLRERDYIDANREIHPLTKADDAILLDNSDMTLKDQLVWIKEILKQREK
ncbi:MAG: (d)CMP kinase, partial [Bacteroidales bacterium]|nr:(d)CMP kinase [Bacteroidales bacterium]